MTTATFSGKTALVTGAAGGIGRAIALRLAAQGAELFALGRTAASLDALRRQLPPGAAGFHIIACDLEQDDAVLSLRNRLDRLDFLVHCAGFIRMGPLESVSMADFDTQYLVNVRAPLLLTQTLLPHLRASQGQIVFINSSVGVRAKEHAGAYAASKHALKAIADTLRLEINDGGVRVLSVFPGNTATGMQEQICREQGKTFEPDAMLKPEDVACAVVDALLLPASAEVTDLHIRPSRKTSG